MRLHDPLGVRPSESRLRGRARDEAEISEEKRFSLKEGHSVNEGSSKGFYRKGNSPGPFSELLRSEK